MNENSTPAGTTNEPLRIGFTGTRRGMTYPQTQAVKKLFYGSKEFELHQGCCLGADEDAVCLAILDPFDKYACVRVIGHPCTIKGQQSEDVISLCDEVRTALPPLERNKVIVDACDLLVATPATDHEELRSGTWATIRYARKAGKVIYLVLTDGSIKREGPERPRPETHEPCPRG